MLVVAVACAIVAGPPGRALASDTQESVLQDDNELVYSAPPHVAHVLDRLVSLGVDQVRISINWAALAPSSRSFRRPHFDATDPGAYPRGVWHPYDTVIQLARERGLGVFLNITSPAPYWAATAPAPASGFRRTYSPSPAAFEDFVRAVATRYGGTYVPGSGPRQESSPGIEGLLPIGGVLGQPPSPPPGAAPLPRVDYWSVWNEPNHGGWLTPQWRRVSAQRWVESSPVIYRRLLDAAWRALGATGHGADTILIGETAARGALGHGVGYSMRPMQFLRALYCVSRSYRPLTGARARELFCPTAGDPASLPSQHPGLFAATGYAHHPYSFTAPPWIPMADPDVATLADLPRLEHALDAISAAYGRLAAGGGRSSDPIGSSLYLTEYGYKSNPPNPFVPFSQVQQAAYINQGEYMAFADPRVRAFAQFLLVDDRPKLSARAGSRSYWSTFQTGLIGLGGQVKPAYTAYRLPVFVAAPFRSERVEVWTQLRAARRGTLKTAAIEYRPDGAPSFAVLRHVQTTSPHGFLVAHVALATGGLLRIAWRDPASGQVLRSRAVRVF
jgi:hypothetical protein